MLRSENLSARGSRGQVGFLTRLRSPFANYCRAIIVIAALLFGGDSSAQFLAPTLVNSMPAIGANNADIILVIVDTSDSMGRLLPQSSATPRPTVLDAVRGALSANLLNPGSFPEFTWAGVQYVGGRRGGINRSCSLNTPISAINAVQIPVTTGASGNFCHLSTWTGAGPFQQPVSAGAFGGTNFFMNLLNPVPAQDYTNLGESLQWILTQQYGFSTTNSGRNFRVLLITDGGESCHRQYSSNLTQDNSPLFYLRNFFTSSPLSSRLSLFITVVAPISGYDVDRMQQWVSLSNSVPKNSGLPSQIAVVGTEAELAAAMGTFRGMYINRGSSNDAADPGAVGETGIDPRILHYNPCQSCGNAGADSTARQCQCCLLAYQGRDCRDRCCSACLVNKSGGNQHFNTRDLFICTAWEDCDTSTRSPWNSALEGRCNATRPALRECYDRYRGDASGPDLSMPNLLADFKVTGFLDRVISRQCTYNLPVPTPPYCPNDGVTRSTQNTCTSTAGFKSGGFPVCQTQSFCNNPPPSYQAQPCQQQCVPQPPPQPCKWQCVPQPPVLVDPDVTTWSQSTNCTAQTTRTFRQCCRSHRRISCGEAGHPGTCGCGTETCHPCRQNCAQEAANLPGTYPVSYCGLGREDFCASIGVCSMNTSDYAFPRSFTGGTMPVAGCGPVPYYSMCPPVSPGLSSVVRYIQNSCGESVP